ncbi:MAG: TaqI-like C-terminal specificity domain-containing protein [Terriglobia bacterium]|jgi:hypothetical protein
MTRPDRQQTVLDILTDFRGLDPLKQLFWSELNYSRVNTPLSRQKWNATAAESLAADPVLFATGGDGFHIIHSRLPTDKLLMGQERPVVSQLLKEHPYALFVFSNNSLNRWHFLNVKYDDEITKRRVFRRITVGPEERLRTASERIALLDLESVGADLFGLSPLTIQKRHDEAFDVEPVTREFFKEYARVFGEVEEQIEGINDKERRRLFTQRLFNRLMFIAFIQKKGWLKFGREGDYLGGLWHDFKRKDKPNRNFYRDRLKLLFFQGLNTPNEVNVIGINRGGFLKELIGQVPYLNGGLFEEDDDDRDAKIVVPDECIEAIFDDLFSRFNFTVTESTPLDMEVAVDPEMLGKIFEELVTGRHETGSYYTPKPVVSFMCREALKGYLGSQLPSEAPENIERFVEEHHPQGLKNPEPVLEALRKVRLCDPACGSGAYLLGMLHELIDLRACLFATSKLDGISTFDRKLQIIQNNLYGVDLDPFAVNIARLRLWLSLAVEYEGDSPPPLPNLDFKIEAGDSLTVAAPTHGLEQGFRKSFLDEYLRLRAEFLTAHHGHKTELRKKIAEIRKTIHGWAHTGSAVDGFDWAVEFTEVFSDGGFDIVLANPPYVRQELIRELKPQLKSVYPDVYMSTADLYIYFYARGLQILKKGGWLVFIAPNRIFRANYAEKLRDYLAKSTCLRTLIDFGDFPVFEAASYPSILITRKKGPSGSETCGSFATYNWGADDPLDEIGHTIRTKATQVAPTALSGSGWYLGNDAVRTLIKKVSSSGEPLAGVVNDKICRGVITGYNKAFVINQSTRDAFVSADPKNAEIIRPFLRGRDVKRWCVSQPEEYLIWTYIGVDMKRYPAIMKHLKEYQKPLEKRQDQGLHWWELRACAYYDDFGKPKIIYPDIFLHQSFAYDQSDSLMVNTLYFMPSVDVGLLGILNSQLMEFYYARVSNQMRGGYRRSFTQYIQKLPIVSPTPELRQMVKTLLRAAKQSGPGSPAVQECENQINELVFHLYGVSAEEKRMVTEELAAVQESQPSKLRESPEYKKYMRETFGE